MPVMAATMLGQGLYDAAEIGWLLGHDSEWVVRWSTPSSAGPGVVVPAFGRMFSFADLVSFRVAMLIRQQGVSDRHLRRGVETLRVDTGLTRPLASNLVISSLATSGASFLSDLRTGELVDIGRGGQGVFQEVVRVHLTRITFGSDGGPTRWTPADGVVIDPEIQAGAPCIVGTRVPTATVAALLDDVEPAEVALDFEVTVEAVLLAAKFEHQLASGFGLAA
jgi:uncharacterized protein (DUF433 family)